AAHRDLPSSPTDALPILLLRLRLAAGDAPSPSRSHLSADRVSIRGRRLCNRVRAGWPAGKRDCPTGATPRATGRCCEPPPSCWRSEEHTSELQSREKIVC